MKTPRPVFFCLLLAAAVVTCMWNAFTDTRGYLFYGAQAPLPPFDPAKVDATLVPDKETILLGEPVFVTFTLRSSDTHDLGVYLGDEPYFNYPLNTRDYFKFKITDAQGGELPLIPGHGPSTTIASVLAWSRLAAGGAYTAPLLLPTRIVFDKPGDYTISVVKLVQFSRPLPRGSGPLNYTGALATVEASVSTTIHVLPADSEKLGVIIDSIGGKLLAFAKENTQEESEHQRIGKDWYQGGLKSGEGYSSFLQFTAIRDDRVVPWLLRAAMEGRNLFIRQDALRALATLHSDAAFDALKTAITAPATDIADIAAGSPAQKERAFRTTVLWAITQSQHPDAIAYALTFRHDRDRGMRFWVMNMAALRMKPDDSLPVLLEFASDSDPGISAEAKSSLYRACRKSDPEVAIPILLSLTHDSNRELAGNARNALEEARTKLAPPSRRLQ